MARRPARSSVSLSRFTPARKGGSMRLALMTLGFMAALFFAATLLDALLR